MPYRGKQPSVAVIRRASPSSPLEERARAVAVGRTVKDVKLDGDYFVLILDNGSVLRFHCPGGFTEEQ